MVRDVAIVGVGQTESKHSIPDKDFRELIYDAAKKAFSDANLTPKDADALITNEYDFYSGVSIADEYTPDQVGMRLKFNNLVCDDGTIALINAYMLILSGAVDIVVVESHSKVASDVVNYPEVLLFALDPIYNRPLGGHPYYIAGMDALKYLNDTGIHPEDLAMVVVKNKNNALRNPYAGFGAKLTVDDVLNSKIVFYPLREYDISPLADYAGVLILASDDAAKSITDSPIWIRGVGHCTESGYPESWVWGSASWLVNASREAYRRARIDNPRKSINVIELTEPFSYQELQYLNAIGVCHKDDVCKLLLDGYFNINGSLPVNPSGGCLGMGYAPQAAGLQRIIEIVLQLRKEAAGRQVNDAEVGMAIGSTSEIVKSGGVVIMST